jgi:hypothetical protein
MIDLSVKTLQELLNVNQDMPTDCFDMAIRVLPHNEPKRLSIAKRKITKHYMDLRFCVSSLFQYCYNMYVVILYFLYLYILLLCFL